MERTQGVDSSSGGGFVEVAFESYYLSLSAQCRQRVGAEGDDMAAEAFTRALQRGGFESVEHCRQWVTVVARRLCFDHLRKSATSSSVDVGRMSLANSEAFVAQDVDDPAKRAELADISSLVHSMLAKLSSLDRELVLLRDAWALSPAEIAGWTGLSAKSVRVMTSRARQRLRSLCSASGFATELGMETGSSEVHGADGAIVASLDQSGRPA